MYLLQNAESQGVLCTLVLEVTAGGLGLCMNLGSHTLSRTSAPQRLAIVEVVCLQGLMLQSIVLAALLTPLCT